MAERAVVTAVLMIMVLSICLYLTENFIPIGKNMDFRDICRSYLMKMEYCSGLDESDCRSLRETLEDIGFTDVSITAPNSAKAGTIMSLDVSAVFSYAGLSGIFSRSETEYEMNYIRKAVARKVINR